MRFRLLASLSLILLFSGACQTSPELAIVDLAAIHNEGDWTPRSPAHLVYSPKEYGVGGQSVPGFRVGEPADYEVEDHKALELAILNRIADIPPGQLDLSLEATAWLIIELLHDDHQEARLQSAAILSDFAAFWVDYGGVRLKPERIYEGNLAESVKQYLDATKAIDEPDYVDLVTAALREVDRSPIQDPLIAARLVAGMARQLRNAPVQVTGGKVVQRTALRAVLSALQAASDDPDGVVAGACRDRYDLIFQYATR